MFGVTEFLQILAALGIFNVWLVRPRKNSRYRPQGASNLREEFAKYGLPDWVRKAVGAAKLTLAALLLVGLWFPVIVPYTASALGALMFIAIAAHLMVGDPPKKSLPAFLIMVLCVLIVAVPFLIGT